MRLFAVGSPYLMFNWCNRRAEKKPGGLPPDEVIHLNWNISSQRWDGPADCIPPFICCLSLARPSEPLAFLDGFTGGDQIGMKLAQSESLRGPIRSGRDLISSSQCCQRPNPSDEMDYIFKPGSLVDYDGVGERTLPFFRLVILDMCNYATGLCHNKGRQSMFVYLWTTKKT